MLLPHGSTPPGCLKLPPLEPLLRWRLCLICHCPCLQHQRLWAERLRPRLHAGSGQQVRWGVPGAALCGAAQWGMSAAPLGRSVASKPAGDAVAAT